MLDDLAGGVAAVGEALGVAADAEDAALVEALAGDGLLVEGGEAGRGGSLTRGNALLGQPAGRTDAVAGGPRSMERATSSQLAYLGQRKHSFQTLRGNEETAA